MLKEIEIDAKELLKYKVLFRDDSNKLTLSLSELMEYNPDLFEKLVNQPDETIAEITNKISHLNNSKNLFFGSIPKCLKTPIANLRSNNLSKMVLINGLIRMQKSVTSKTEYISYECPRCSSHLKVLQIKNTLTEPTKCSCGSRGRFIKLNQEYVDIQEMELEENIDDVGSRQPQKIKLYLKGPITDPNLSNFQVGNKVEVLGILRELPIYLIGADKEKIVIEYMLEAIYMRNMESTETDLKISDEEMQEIKEIASNNPLEYLAQNIAPNIQGLDELKKAVVLFLAKGVTKNYDNNVRIRGDLHLFVVGDASVGKSSLLKNIKKRVANCRMVEGKASSRAGIIYTLIKEKNTDRWQLEAGDIVLANEGFLIIDELDKVSDEDKLALHGPMESGEVLVSKAGIHALLKASTSVFACANPKLGKFSLEAPLLNQIDISSTLLSRFDLTFIVKDTPNESEDRIKAQRILKAHRGQLTSEISADLIKKYFLFASKLKPSISDEIAKLIEDIYSDLRKSCIQEGQFVGFPIATRHLEGLIRLSEASAKVRLSNQVEMIDVLIAKELFEHSLENFGYNKEFKSYDLSNLNVKTKVAKKQKYYVILDLIKDLMKVHNEVPKELIIDEVNSKFGYPYYETEELIRMLHQNAEIFESSSNRYKLNPKNI